MFTSDIVYFNPLLQCKVNNCTVKFAACIAQRDTAVIIRIINIAFLKRGNTIDSVHLVGKIPFSNKALKIFTKNQLHKFPIYFLHISPIIPSGPPAF